MTNHVSLLLTKIVSVHLGGILEKDIVLPLKWKIKIIQIKTSYKNIPFIKKKPVNNFCFASSVNNIIQSDF